MNFCRQHDHDARETLTTVFVFEILYKRD